VVVPVVFSLIEGLRDRMHRKKPPMAQAVAPALVAAATIIDGSSGPGDGQMS
jgi:hypothetical protein